MHSPLTHVPLESLVRAQLGAAHAAHERPVSVRQRMPIQGRGHVEFARAQRATVRRLAVRELVLHQIPLSAETFAAFVAQERLLHGLGHARHMPEHVPLEGAAAQHHSRTNLARKIDGVRVPSLVQLGQPLHRKELRAPRALVILFDGVVHLQMVDHVDDAAERLATVLAGDLPVALAAEVVAELGRRTICVADGAALVSCVPLHVLFEAWLPLKLHSAQETLVSPRAATRGGRLEAGRRIDLGDGAFQTLPLLFLLALLLVGLRSHVRGEVIYCREAFIAFRTLEGYGTIRIE